MDPATMTEFWIDLAVNMPFVAFLLYNWHVSRKDMILYRSEMKEIRTEAKAEEQRIRERFESVISDMQGDRDKLIKGLESKIGALDAKSSSLEKGIKKLFLLLDRLKEQINELKIKDEVRSLRDR